VRLLAYQKNIRMKISVMSIFPEKAETERLYLRSYRAGDGPMLFAVSTRNRNHLAEFQSGSFLRHLESEGHAETTASKLASVWKAGHSFAIGVFETETDEWVGQVTVAQTNLALPEFVIGFAADVNCEGKGYMSEAINRVLATLFLEMGAHRVKGDCHDENKRSWRLFERCGFRREGHLRENKRNPDGSLHGDYLYGILRQEYVER